jgi:hypothetical protein
MMMPNDFPRTNATRKPPSCPSCTGALCAIDIGAPDRTLAYWACDCGYEGEPVGAAQRGECD